MADDERKHMDKTKFKQLSRQTTQWIQTHQEQFWAIFGSVVLAILFVGLAINHHTKETDEAWTQLGVIQGQLVQGKLNDARKGLDAWQPRFQNSSSATYAKFLRADLLYKTSDYVQASQVYGDVYQSGHPDPLKPLALSAQISSEEMAGHIPQAQALAQSFLEKYPDHFLSGQNYIAQARLSEIAGNPVAAAAVYERFVLLFPQSPWTTLAKTRLQALGKSVPSKNPILTPESSFSKP